MAIRNNNRHSNQLSVESLEGRQLVAVDLLGNGTWAIAGTNASDEIYVARDEVDSNVLLVEINGRVVDEQYEADVSSIHILGRGGNDFIEIDESAGAIAIPTQIYGQSGHDIIIGGSGVDRIFGGSGHDELLGHAGNDFIYGGPGDDYLEGGRGNDTLRGGRGFNDIVDAPDVVQPNYTNYLVANDVVIASSYGNAEFYNNARKQLQQFFPNREIVLTDTRELWYNGGAVHCVTNVQPLL